MGREALILGLCIGALTGNVLPPARHTDNHSVSIEADPDITSSIRGPGATKPIPKGGGTYRVGEPYVIGGRTYIPREEPDYRAQGIASWYGDWFHGRLTANGERYDMHAISAAHPTLPLPSYVRVTNLENNRSLVVRVNDRGPFRDGRIIDMSLRAAKLLGFYERGLARVQVEYLGPARLEGSDDDYLAATLRRAAPQQSDTAFAPLRQIVTYTQTGSVASSPDVVALFQARQDRAEVRASAGSYDGFPNLIFD
jgi:rare lipoprotein A